MIRRRWTTSYKCHEIILHVDRSETFKRSAEPSNSHTTRSIKVSTDETKLNPNWKISWKFSRDEHFFLIFRRRPSSERNWISRPNYKNNFKSEQSRDSCRASSCHENRETRRKTLVATSFLNKSDVLTILEQNSIKVNFRVKSFSFIAFHSF